MTAYDSLILADGATCYVPLCEPTGLTFADLTGNGHTGTGSASVRPGVAGPVAGEDAADFGYPGAFVHLARPETLPYNTTATTPFTWEFWFKQPSASASNLIFSLQSFNSYDENVAFGVVEVDLYNTSPNLRVRFLTYPAVVAQGSADVASITGWQHVTLVYDGASVLIYANGAPMTMDYTGSVPAWAAAPNLMTIGGERGDLDPTDRATAGAQGPMGLCAMYPTALTACQVRSHYDLATTGSYTPCSDWLRLKHSNGRSYIQQNGEQVQVVAGAAGVLDLPLPVLGAAPPTLLGKDPATGVPAFCPAPIPTTTTVVLGGGGGSQPAPAPQCVQMRCGVSGACRDHLVSLYQDWSHWLDPIFQAAATLGVAAAIVGIPWDWTVDLELGAVIKGGIISLLHDFGSVITGNLLPVLDLDLQNDIQRALFDHLTCTNDQVQVSADNVAAWKAALDALTTWPIASLAGPFCGLLLQYTPLARWQAAASTASPSTACDAWP